MIPFFCGQSSECSQPSNQSLQTAITNLEHNYLVVGVTEQMDDFFTTLEKIFPRYFKDVTQSWRITGMFYVVYMLSPRQYGHFY